MTRRTLALCSLLLACALASSSTAFARHADTPSLATGSPDGATTTTDSTIPSSVAGESPISVELTTTQTPVGTLGTNGADTTGAALAGSDSLATAAATIYQITWSLNMHSILYGIAWSETQKGSYYRNGTYVWQNPRFGWDTGGFHRCGYGSGIAFSIHVQSCSKVGDPSTGHMTLADQFRVSVLFYGFPIYATHEMGACAYPGGALTTCIWN